MWRSFFLVGALTGFVCGLALVLTPLPEQAGIATGNLVSVPPAIYRMDGVITRNTCPMRPIPWPHLWEVTPSSLIIGNEVIRARFMRAATVYEATRESPDACALATWKIKLVPEGNGLRGTASWELQARDRAGPGCAYAGGLPCLVEADILGLPQANETVEVSPR